LIADGVKKGRAVFADGMVIKTGAAAAQFFCGGEKTCFGMDEELDLFSGKVLGEGV
jgi:hypothetical protein